ncbi:hypothetical protein JQ577_25790 [Bradyrhizobium diazoefficiens]|nr:hypothetical protein [Bradyrhizobium diazoefficiens]MBR1111867.1 hypothetical protein [Bradyrhizobium diazoefficiens]
MVPLLFSVTLPTLFSLTAMAELLVDPVTVPVLVMVVPPVAPGLFCTTLIPEKLVAAI